MKYLFFLIINCLATASLASTAFPVAHRAFVLSAYDVEIVYLVSEDISYDVIGETYEISWLQVSKLVDEILEKTSLDNLVELIKQLEAGKIYHEGSFTIAKKFAKNFLNRKLWDMLSGREKEIVALAYYGKSSRQIGLELEISNRTVDTHLANIFKKTGTKNRTEVASRFGPFIFPDNIGESID